ncbi:rod shape-determining protein MreC [Oscillospiraceae bacterium PP1C4]
MRDFYKSIHFKILFSVLILLLFFMLRAAWTGGLSPILSQTVGVIVTPLQKASSSISYAVSGYFQRYRRADEIALENEALHTEVNALREQMVDFEQYKQENANLKEFLDIKEQNPDFKLEPAAVVARDPNDRFYSFTIDKGSINGVSLRDPVISADGLVGVVKEVGLNYSKVLTILDVGVDVGAYDARTRDIGIITGAIDLAGDGFCKLTYLPRESGATAGDLVVTTGGGIFPKGLVIGSISQVKTEAGGISLYALVKPAANIPSLTDVMVIKAYNGQEAGNEP